MATNPSPTTSFFQSTLPRLLPLRASLFDKMRGSLALVVEGEGDWTLTFGDHRRPDALVSGASLDADCVAIYSRAGFEALLGGAATPPAALIGDAKLLGRLGQLLVEPARGALGARLAHPQASAA